MIMTYFNFLLMIVFILTSLAFMTLMERKILGVMHFRLGPDKVGFYGLFQPFSDALKLFSKDSFFLKYYQMFLWNMSPVFLLFILFSIIFNLPLKDMLMISSSNSFMIILILISLSVLPFLFSGIMSFSKYGVLGSYRCVLQMLSYEIMITFCFIFFMISLKSFSILEMTYMSNYSGLMKLIYVFLFVLFLFEMGRTPFDFIEGESELVSGFNTEYWGPYFSMFFIYEYGMLVVISSLISLLIFSMFSKLFIFFSLLLMVLIRASFPRYRYDLMIIFMWKHMFFIFSLILMSSFISM